MRANSLALRLFLSATTWTVVILFATGVVLSSFYRHAVERAFDRRLGVPVNPQRPRDERLHRDQVVDHQRHLAPACADVAKLAGARDVRADAADPDV